MPKHPPLTFDTVRQIAGSFPGVEEGTAYGTPAFRVGKHFLARLREDGESLAVKCGFEERDSRLQANPKSFFTTDHYRGYPTVLVRLATVSPDDLRDLFEEAWRRLATKRMLAEQASRGRDGPA